MPNVVVLTKDERVRRQVELLCSELEYDNLHVGYFKSSAEFERVYFSEKSDPNQAVFDQIHLVIFALDSIEGKSGPWIEKTRKGLADFGLFTRGTEVRMLMLKYEDDNVNLMDIIHPRLDDLIYLPLDRLLFLQKLDIILNLPRTVKPRFLFSQDVNFNIEISKVAKLDRLSDVGLAIRNPIALKKGVPAHFYVQLPADKVPLSIHGKVFKSEVHPEFENQNLAYFNYCSLNRNDLSRIRRILSKSAQYKSLIDDNYESFRYDERNIFLSEDQRKSFNVIILEPDEKSGLALRTSLSKDMDRINPIYENSYSLFLHKYFRPKTSNLSDPPRAVRPEELYINPIRFVVDASTKQLFQVEKTPEVSEMIIGRPANELFSTPQGWNTLFSDKESQLIIDEALFLASQGRRVRKIVKANGGMDEACALAVSFAPAAEEGQIQISLEAAPQVEISDAFFLPDAPETLDCIIIDSAFIPSDVNTWIQWIKKRALAAKLIHKPENLRIIIMTEKEVDPPSAWMNAPEIMGIFIKPLDIRQLCFTLGEGLQNTFTPYRMDNISWAQPNLVIHVAKESILESLSEYGVTLKSDRPIVPGNFVYIRKSIYDNAPNGCLAARVYSSQEHPSEKGQYQILATYFGINDFFLKYARTWIRDHYAALKKSDKKST